MKVLYCANNPSDPTSFYRISGVLPYIENEKINFQDISLFNQWGWNTFTGADIFIFQRPYSEADVRIINLAKDCGVRVILDYDDDLLNVPECNGTFQMYSEAKETIQECLSIADEVWVSTESIKSSYTPYNTNIVTIPNAHNDFLFPIENKKPFNMDNKIVLWRGGGSHEEDVYSVANEIINLVNENEDWTFEFWGHRFTYLETRCRDNYICRIGMGIMEYFKKIHELNPQIAICPLVDNTFNRGKSNIAWIEATYAGAAFFGNINLPEFNQNGIFCISKLDNEMSSRVSLLSHNHKSSWGYIKEFLLLSQINKIREQRILNHA